MAKTALLIALVLLAPLAHATEGFPEYPWDDYPDQGTGSDGCSQSACDAWAAGICAGPAMYQVDHFWSSSGGANHQGACVVVCGYCYWVGSVCYPEQHPANWIMQAAYCGS